MSLSEQATVDQSQPTHAQLEQRAARLRQPGKQFTLGYFTQVPSPADQPARRTYDELIESIVAAEEIGYDSVWIGQRHFSPEDGGVSSPSSQVFPSGDEPRCWPPFFGDFDSLCLSVSKPAGRAPAMPAATS